MMSGISRKRKENLKMKSTGREAKRELLFSFLKAQLSAFLGGIFDFSIYTVCLQYFGFSAHGSNIISGSLGAIVNFAINRYWSFSSHSVPIGMQLWKFVIVVVGSITLKSTGIYILVDYLLLNPFLSKICVELLVSLGFNFFLQKYWVFRK